MTMETAFDVVQAVVAKSAVPAGAQVRVIPREVVHYTGGMHPSDGLGCVTQPRVGMAGLGDFCDSTGSQIFGSILQSAGQAVSSIWGGGSAGGASAGNIVGASLTTGGTVTNTVCANKNAEKAKKEQQAQELELAKLQLEAQKAQQEGLLAQLAAQKMTTQKMLLFGALGVAGIAVVAYVAKR